MKKIFCAIFIFCVLALVANEPSQSKYRQFSFIRTTENVFTSKHMDGRNDHDQSRGVIKMNLTQLVFKNMSFQAEYGFHKSLSGALGVSVLIPRVLPGFFAKEDPSGEGLRNTRFTGWAITPEFRFYPGPKIDHKAPYGFYLAPYFRVAQYKLTSSLYVFDGNQELGYSLTAKYRGATAGLMIGSQWIIGKHFSLDLWIAGIGFGFANFSMEAVGKNIFLNDPQQAELKETVEMVMDGVSFLSGDVKTTSNSAKVDFGGLPMTSIRTLGLCIGFAF